MTPTTETADDETIRQLVSETLEHDLGEDQTLGEAIDALDAGEHALLLDRLDAGERQQLLEAIPNAVAADVIEHLSDGQAASVVSELPASTAAEIVEEMRSEDRADLLGDLSERRARAVLGAMTADAAADARRLSEYADDVAGGLTGTEVLSVPDTATVGDVIDELSAGADRYRDYDVQYVYVLDPAERLVGVLPLRELLLTRRSKPVGDVMIGSPLSVSDMATLPELEEFFDTHAFFGVPAVDAEGRLVGVVRRSSVEEALAEREGETYRRSQGLIAEELRSMPLAVRSRRRLAWLSVNILLNVLAASVIAAFQDTLSAVIALAVFLPIISDMSGCSGNQAVAVSMRELSLGLARPQDLLRVWLKEAAVGVVNGVALGLLIAVVACFWQGNAWLGLVVGVALCVNTLVAVSIGGCVPLVLKRFGFDPAVASGPLLTTVTDMCGFFLVLGLATLLLPKLL